ncbi:MAG: carbohydrate-binding family 9-like protein [Anaerolineales bacterium]
MFERPLYTCYRASSPLSVDGRLEETSWKRTPPIHLVLADTGETPRQDTEVRLLWNDDYLYAAFVCQDTDIWGTTTERDQDIYNQEVVEIFVDADCDGRAYVEIEVNPLNAVLDLFMLIRGERRKGLWDWDSEGLRTTVSVDGNPRQRSSDDRSWIVEMAIPMTDFLTAPNLPPRPGDEWYINLYRIDRAHEGDEYSAWSPPGRIDYHTPECFGRLKFSAKKV